MLFIKLSKHILLNLEEKFDIRGKLDKLLNIRDKTRF